MEATYEYDLTTTAHVSHTLTTDTKVGISTANLGSQNRAFRYDDQAGGQFVSSHHDFYGRHLQPPSETNWWINNLQESAVTANISYSSGHTPPANTQASAQSIDIRFSWNADRTPLTKVVQSGVANQESTTTYTYPSPSYGLPSQVTVSAPSVSTNRSTTYTYTKDGSTAASDGYFLLTSTNALSQKTSMTVQTRDGQVLTAIDPNNVTVATTYDAFGRATKVTHKDANSRSVQADINSAYTWCTPSQGNSAACSGVGEDGNDALAAYRVTTVQQGAPTNVSWADVLGRKIKQATAGFKDINGTSLEYQFIGTFSEFDDAGTPTYQSTPYAIGTATPYLTQLTYDALNRVTSKVSA